MVGRDLCSIWQNAHLRGEHHAENVMAAMLVELF